ncbi:Lrp/AsnC family transcriptional regulator [Streptomyces endophyticus]|uniref:Lrp/AsnC family transcriptional regulator n=1 Tax=Streptomyces endophyticus TaxID=714166 RepID=A0ABU6FBG1_9ACTN|nr:Lrp/AsnC family transcriptional regulator [Streptomyces endophyticus]MEB8341376.1 Lrp/AsnC family transcriptional regulator [Streptomyces endophyticus]
MNTQHSEPSVVDRARIDELDLALVHALQVNTRAPWTLIGEALDIDPVTAARRWERLARSGAAWVDGYLALDRDEGSVYAQVEIDTGGHLPEEALTSLAADSRMLSLKQTSGGRDLLAIVGASSFDDLARYTGERISRLPGVRGTRIHVITAVPFEGAQWRLRSLTPSQRAVLRPESPRNTAVESPVPDEPIRPIDRRIAHALGTDGRMPLSGLARATGASTATVRRRLRVLTAGGRLSLRCTLARPLTEFPVSAVYFGSVPAENLDPAVQALRTLPGLRMCSITAGTHNLILDIWLRTLAEVHTTEALLNRRLADLGLRITERAVVLRTLKHAGRLLDRRGHSVGAVPLRSTGD